ncbi:MAG: hypothetical protein J6W86_06235 [Bacteroidales bacterium]|nr:hypothetical protein [Bacteroidales bacterium]
MKKFRLISAFLLIAAVPVLFSCSKKSSSNDEDQTETFQTINAKFFYGNSSAAPENIVMGVGNSITLYVGNGSTKEVFNGAVKWTSTGSGTLDLSAVQKTSALAAPNTKAGYNYSSTSATTSANTILRATAKADGLVSLTAKDAAGNSKVLMITIYPKDSE